MSEIQNLYYIEKDPCCESPNPEEKEKGKLEEEGKNQNSLLHCKLGRGSGKEDCTVKACVL